GAGADTLFGDAAANLLNGGAGDDTLLGDAGDDIVNGGAGNDFLIAGSGLGDDAYDGGSGIDTISFASTTLGVSVDLTAGTATGSETGTDTIAALSVENVIGGAGNDVLLGDSNANTLTGNAGDDIVFGAGGDDVLVAASGLGNDSYDGGVGVDTLSFASATNTVFVDVGTGQATGIDIDDDVFTNIEVIAGGAGDDFMAGDAAANTLLGAGGNDLIFGVEGDDTLVGEAGDDTLFGGAGEDDLFGGDGADFLQGGNGVNDLVGGAGNDVLSGNVRGQTGLGLGSGLNDFNRADYSAATGGINAILSATGTVTGDASVGTDTLRFIDEVIGSDFDDTFSADELHVGNFRSFNSFEGRGGDDTITGNGFTRISYRQATSGVTVDLDAGTAIGDASVGTDTIIGGVNRVRGSTFDDTLSGTDDVGFEDFRGEAGDDVIDGRAGTNDRADYFTSSAGVNVNLSTGVALDGLGGTDTLIGIERVRGSNFDDTLIGDSGANTLESGLGTDLFVGGGGDDKFIGNIARGAIADFNTVDYSSATAGVDIRLSAQGTVTGDASVGTDTLIGIDRVFGSAFADTFVADSQHNGNFDLFNEFQGGAGNDTITGNGATRVSYRDATSGVDIDLDDGTVSGDASVGVDTFTDSVGGGFNFGIGSVRGSNFDDSYFGGLGVDSFRGQSGNDFIDGGFGDFDRADYRNSSAGVDVNLLTGVGQDGFGDTDTLTNVERLRGSEFADTLIGDNGDNRLQGQGGADFLDGGFGVDEANFDTSGPGGVTVNLVTGLATDNGGATDTLVSIENVTGTEFDDTLIGDSADNVLQGLEGNNLLVGSAGNDTLKGFANGSQADLNQVDYSAGSAALTVELGVDNSFGQATSSEFGTDSLQNIDLVFGGSGDDTFTVGTLHQGNFTDFAEIEGMAGNDTITGNGRTRIGYQRSIAGVTVDLQAGTALDGFGSTDTITGGVNQVRGSAFDDVITGSGANELFRGGAGDDVIDGAGGFDRIVYVDSSTGVSVNLATGLAIDGQGGFDTLSNIESIRGSEHADVLIGDANDNELIGGLGADFLDGGAGIDEADFASFTAGGVTANLTTGIAIDQTGGVDTLVNIENLAGTDFNDTLTGDAGANTINSRNGNDLIIGSAGNDALIGGTGGGFTQIDYSAGSAPLTVNLGVFNSLGTATSAEFGADTLQFTDKIFGGDGNDVFTAGTLHVGSSGSDFNEFEGMGGNDVITGNGNTRVSYQRATAGVTVDFGATGTGTALGDASVGSDTLLGVTQVRGSDFDDTLLGSDTAAFEQFRGRGGNDFIDGGGGSSDEVRYSSASTGITVDLSGGSTVSFADGFGGIDTITNIERIRATDFSDHLTGNSAANRLTGQDGDDTLIGGSGNDDLRGDGGNDVLEGGIGADNVKGGAGDDILIADSASFGGSLSDTYDGGSGRDLVDYSTINEVLFVNLAAQTATFFVTTSITDTLIGIEEVIGGTNDDFLVGSAGDDYLDGGAGEDHVFGDAGDDDLNGSGGDDRVFGGQGDDVLGGQDGNDLILGDAGNDLLFGDEGADTLYGGAGDDFLDGDTGDDIMHGGDGRNVLENGVGNDFLTGSIRGRLEVDTGISDFNIADYSDAEAGITVTVSDTGTVTGDASVGIDTIRHIDEIIGSSFDDIYTADNTHVGNFNQFNSFRGLGGNDTITGNGFTRVSYQGATDAVTVDLLAGSAIGNDSVGTDTFLGGVTRVRGSAFGDTLLGSNDSVFEQFRGEAGDDV
ncbi:MAG: hypothetical protein JKY20_03380, partial [Alphaproteobacteria bacterium]|nr:hypothetical protein [Alphaproteobacteria bacterium]